MSVDVKDHGARGDGVTDDTAAIAAAIDRWQRRGGRLHFPAGLYPVSDTLLIGNGKEVGGSITCEGPNGEYHTQLRDRDSGQAQTSVKHLGSALVWRGGDQPLIVFRGANLTWDGPALWGTRGKRRACGLLIDKHPGLGTGKFHFRQLSLSHFAEGLSFAGRTNCDLCAVDRMLAYDCGTAVRVSSSQNTGNVFGSLIAHSVDRVFGFDELTHTVVRHAVLNSSVSCFAWVSSAGAAAGGLFVDSMKIDPASPDVRLVECSQWLSYGRFRFSNLTGTGTERFRLRGECSLEVDGAVDVGHVGMIESRGLESRRVHVLLRNCRLRDDVTGESVLQGRDRWTDVVIQGGTRVTDNVPVEPDRLEP